MRLAGEGVRDLREKIAYRESRGIGSGTIGGLKESLSQQEAAYALQVQNFESTYGVSVETALQAAPKNYRTDRINADLYKQGAPLPNQTNSIYNNPGANKQYIGVSGGSGDPRSFLLQGQRSQVVGVREVSRAEQFDRSQRRESMVRPGIYRLSSGEVVTSSLGDGQYSQTAIVRQPVASGMNGRPVYAPARVVTGIDLFNPENRTAIAQQAGKYATVGGLYNAANQQNTYKPPKQPNQQNGRTFSDRSDFNNTNTSRDFDISLRSYSQKPGQISEEAKGFSQRVEGTRKREQNFENFNQAYVRPISSKIGTVISFASPISAPSALTSSITGKKYFPAETTKLLGQKIVESPFNIATFPINSGEKISSVVESKYRGPSVSKLQYTGNFDIRQPEGASNIALTASSVYFFGTSVVRRNAGPFVPTDNRGVTVNVRGSGKMQSVASTAEAAPVSPRYTITSTYEARLQGGLNRLFNRKAEFVVRQGRAGGTSIMQTVQPLIGSEPITIKYYQRSNAPTARVTRSVGGRVVSTQTMKPIDFVRARPFDIRDTVTRREIQPSPNVVLQDVRMNRILDYRETVSGSIQARTKTQSVAVGEDFTRTAKVGTVATGVGPARARLSTIGSSRKGAQLELVDGFPRNENTYTVNFGPKVRQVDITTKGVSTKSDIGVFEQRTKGVTVATRTNTQISGTVRFAGGRDIQPATSLTRAGRPSLPQRISIGVRDLKILRSRRGAVSTSVFGDSLLETQPITKLGRLGTSTGAIEIRLPRFAQRSPRGYIFTPLVDNRFEKTVINPSKSFQSSQVSSSSEVASISSVSLIPAVSQTPKVSTVSRTAQISVSRQMSRTIPTSRITPGFDFDFKINNTTPPPPPPFIPPFVFPRGGGGFGGSSGGRRSGGDRGYTPSLYALGAGVTGRASRAAVVTGLGVRPIIRGRRSTVVLS